MLWLDSCFYNIKHYCQLSVYISPFLDVTNMRWIILLNLIHHLKFAYQKWPHQGNWLVPHQVYSNDYIETYTKFHALWKWNENKLKIYDGWPKIKGTDLK